MNGVFSVFEIISRKTWTRLVPLFAARGLMHNLNGAEHARFSYLYVRIIPDSLYARYPCRFTHVRISPYAFYNRNLNAYREIR